MNKTEIEWCDMTWNPVTGCLNNCPYCYARKIANRFWVKHSVLKDDCMQPNNGLHEIRYQNNCGFRYGFEPTLHTYRLTEPRYIKKPQNIFVCSMADLFGEWVPDEWIQRVFEACKSAPQHRYLFLTKNPARYIELAKKGLLPTDGNFLFGTTVTNDDTEYWYSDCRNWFLSIEPVMGKFSGGSISGETVLWQGPRMKPTWVIIGAETGNRKDKIIPKREWVEDIVNECRRSKIPVFLKNSLKEIWGGPLIQEYPWKGAA